MLWKIVLGIVTVVVAAAWVTVAGYMAYLLIFGD